MVTKSIIAIFISDKVDLKSKTVSIDKEGHYIMIQVSTQQEDTTITNIQPTSEKKDSYPWGVTKNYKITV